ELQQLCDFVECFTGGIVDGLAEDPVLPDTGDVNQDRMAAGNNERNHGERGRGLSAPTTSYRNTEAAPTLKQRRVQVRFHVVDSDERLTGGEGNPLTGVEADEK